MYIMHKWFRGKRPALRHQPVGRVVGHPATPKLYSKGCPSIVGMSFYIKGSIPTVRDFLL